MEIALLTLILFFVILLVLRLVFKDQLKFVKLSGAEYALNRRLKEILFEQTPYAVVATDQFGKVLMCNGRFHKKFGYAEEEMIGQSITKIIPERFRNAHELGMQHFRDTGESNLINNDNGMELFGLHKNGSEFPVHIKLILINDHGFKTIGGFIRNITVEKEKERILLDKIFLLERGESCAGIGSFNWNTLTKEVRVSKNFYRIFNLDEDDLVTSDMLMEMVYHKDRLNTALVITQAMEKGEDYKTTYRRMMRDGSLRLLEVRGCQIYDEDGEPIGITGTIQKLADGVDGT